MISKIFSGGLPIAAIFASIIFAAVSGSSPATVVAIGSIMFGKEDENGKLIPAPMELVRLAIPRRVYTQSHMEYVIETFEEILETKTEVKGIEITQQPEFLRHFTSHFKRLE